MPTRPAGAFADATSAAVNSSRLRGWRTPRGSTRRGAAGCGASGTGLGFGWAAGGDFGSTRPMPIEEMKKIIRLFAEEVMPEFRR